MDQRDIDRFWKRVDIQGEGDCWVMRGSKSPYDYGRVKVDGKTLPSNRFAWLITHGDPGKLYVLHSCDNRRCVNPKHLFLGTQSDNMRDMVEKGRHPRLRLTRKDAVHIRALFEAGGITRAQLAEKYDVWWDHIDAIVKHRIWP